MTEDKDPTSAATKAANEIALMLQSDPNLTTIAIARVIDRNYQPERAEHLKRKEILERWLKAKQLLSQAEHAILHDADPIGAMLKEFT